MEAPRRLTMHVRRVGVVQVMDRVRYTAAWLRSTGQYTGPVPFLKGRVVGVSKRAWGNGFKLIHVQWEGPCAVTRGLDASLTYDEEFSSILSCNLERCE